MAISTRNVRRNSFQCLQPMLPWPEEFGETVSTQVTLL